MFESCGLDPTPCSSGSLLRAVFPEGKAFAFTILDDTDDATVANVAPLYDLFTELGFRTTKTVWALACPPEEQGPFFAGQTLDDPEYLAFVRVLVARGFEVAFHNATMGSSTRGRTHEALDVLSRTFGAYPRVHCNHGENRENLYWGSSRYRLPPLRWVARLARRVVGAPEFEGDREGSPYFWGDTCKAHFDYVRAFAFTRLNNDRIPPGRPYRDPGTPWVTRWFNTSDAPDAAAFKRLVHPGALDRLHQEGGYSIVSTHLGKGFTTGGRVDTEVEATLRYLASMSCWFVPVGELLDFLRTQRGDAPIDFLQRLRLEVGHVLDRVGSHSRP